MSSALFTAVTTTLKGDNYDTWASEMEAFLQATGLESAITTDQPSEPSPLVAANAASVEAWKDYEVAFKAWKEIDTKVIGNIRLRLSPSIRILSRDYGNTAKKLWKYLATTYNVKSLGAVFNDFAAAMAVRIPYKQNPLSSMMEIGMHFTRMEEADIGLADHLEALILLSKLPSRYSVTRYGAGECYHYAPLACSTITLIVSLIQYITLGVAMYLTPFYSKEDMYTSSLTGKKWLEELLVGHPGRAYIALGMRRHVFLALVLQIRCMGYMKPEKSTIILEESLAIFLYTCVTGLAIDHVAEQFQHSKSTISEPFHKILDILSGPKFYNKYDVLGAIDGTHINCTPTAENIHSARNWKGGVTQNCLAAVSFDMRFLLFIGGWDGCAADATMYGKAHLKDFSIPPGKSYLADAGFGICDALLVPYWSVRYHLAEWGHANQR